MQPQLSAKPAKKQSKWSPEEDARIIRLRGEGMKWDEISNHLPGRSSISCRLHYQNYLEKKSVWDEDKKNKLALVYERMKAQMWSKVAEELGVPWRAAEAMHWQMGEMEMTRRAGSSPFVLAPQKTDPAQRNATVRRPGSQPLVQESSSREYLPYGTRPPYTGYSTSSDAQIAMPVPYTVSQPTREPSAYSSNNTPIMRPSSTAPAPPPAPSAPAPPIESRSPPNLPPLHVDVHYKAAPSLAPIHGQPSPRPRGSLPGIAELTTGLDLYESQPRDSTRASLGSEPRWDGLAGTASGERDFHSLKRRASQPLSHEDMSFRKQRR